MRVIASLFVLLVAACGVTRRPEGSPLVGAARTGDVAMVRQLLARGADPNAPDGVNDWTPLLHAIHKAQPATIAALLDGGADVNRASPSGETPLMMAAGYGYSGIVKMLLSRGADPSRRDHHGETALDYALAGMSDVDRFTFFSCQNDTVALLANRGVQPAAASVRWANLKRCR
ncbi:MAG: ankyrin repeat domain-containing protein [Thermoanaerobaculia bacterium]